MRYLSLLLGVVEEVRVLLLEGEHRVEDQLDVLAEVHVHEEFVAVPLCHAVALVCRDEALEEASKISIF